jgi:hypothetical protein
MVKEIKEQSVVVENQKKELIEMPFGVLVWAAVSFCQCNVLLYVTRSCCYEGKCWQKPDSQSDGKDWGSPVQQARLGSR